MFFISVEISNRKKIKRDLKLFINENIMIINFRIVILNNKQSLGFYYKRNEISINSKIILTIVIIFLVVLRTYLNTNLLRKVKTNDNIVLLNKKEDLYHLPLEEKVFLSIRKPKVRNIDFFALKTDKTSINENLSDKSSSMEKRSSSSFFNESFEVITEELNHYHGNIGPKKKDSEEEKIENISNSKPNNFYDYFYGNSNIIDFDISVMREEFESRNSERKEHFE